LYRLDDHAAATRHRAHTARTHTRTPHHAPPRATHYLPIHTPHTTPLPPHSRTLRTHAPPTTHHAPAPPLAGSTAGNTHRTTFARFPQHPACCGHTTPHTHTPSSHTRIPTIPTRRLRRTRHLLILYMDDAMLVVPRMTRDNILATPVTSLLTVAFWTTSAILAVSLHSTYYIHSYTIVFLLYTCASYLYLYLSVYLCIVCSTLFSLCLYTVSRFSGTGTTV